MSTGPQLCACFYASLIIHYGESQSNFTHVLGCAIFVSDCDLDVTVKQTKVTDEGLQNAPVNLEVLSKKKEFLVLPPVQLLCQCSVRWLKRDMKGEYEKLFHETSSQVGCS